MFADEASTTVTDNEYNHTLSANVLGICFMEFNNPFLVRREGKRGSGGREGERGGGGGGGGGGGEEEEKEEEE